MQYVLVTGANRGIGLEFVRQCLECGDRVHAGCRHPDAANDLKTLPDHLKEWLSVFRLDIPW